MKKCIFLIIILFGLYLGIHNGYLALFNGDSRFPDAVLPYRSALYPKIDQEALADKIPIKSSTQLKKLLEDFVS